MPRNPLPHERRGITRKIEIAGGAFSGYINVGTYDDGRPGEVFLTVHKQGSFDSGMCHALALIISLALQRGVPVEDIADKLTGLTFDPQGVTGDQNIPWCRSVCDYIGKWMRARFCSPKAEPNADEFITITERYVVAPDGQLWPEDPDERTKWELCFGSRSPLVIPAQGAAWFDITGGYTRAEAERRGLGRSAAW